MSYKIIESCNGCGACVKICPVEAIWGEKQMLHVIDRTICIECGACGRICPQESVHDPFGITCVRIKRSEWEKPRFDWNICMSCTICHDTCPVSCIALSRPVGNEDPHAYPALRVGKPCIGCGFCALECPVNAITMAVPVKEQKKQVAAKS
jgi:Na+-translocating ferredoxin:NAD+ oxidoreductase subunit B